MEPPFRPPAYRLASSPTLVDSAVNQLAGSLRSAVLRAARGGRPPELVRWTRRIGEVTLAHLIMGALLPLLPSRPKGNRATAAIIAALEERAPEDVATMAAATRATLGWSLLAAVADALVDVHGGPVIALEKRTSYRTSADRTRKIDCYHVVADASWLAALRREPGSGDWLIPASITICAPATRVGGGSSEPGIAAPYASAARLLGSTEYRVNRAVLQAAVTLYEGLDGSGRQSVTLSQIIGARLFRFAVRTDFRGQLLLGAGDFGPQGSDVSRALLLFAEPAPLGANGRQELANHGFRMFKGDGAPGHASLAWTKSHQQVIKAVATAPADHTWWRAAAQPWQFLAFCCEWARILELGTGSKVRSGLPIHLPLSVRPSYEAACQIVGLERSPIEVEDIIQRVHSRVADLAAGGEEWARRWYNSSPPPGFPALARTATLNALVGYSRYSSTASICRLMTQTGRPDESDLLDVICAGVTLTPEKACAHLSSVARRIDTTRKRQDRERLLAELAREAAGGDEIARRWLSTEVINTLTAREAGTGTAALVRHLRNAGAWGVVEQAFHGRVVTRYSPSPEAACGFLVQVVEHVLNGLAGGTRLVAAARAWAAEQLRSGRSVEWTVPSSGLHVRLPYCRSEKRQATIRLESGQKIQPAFYERSGEADARRQLMRLPHDLIRAAHAAEVALVLDRAGTRGLRLATADAGGCVVRAGDAPKVHAVLATLPDEQVWEGMVIPEHQAA